MNGHEADIKIARLEERLVAANTALTLAKSEIDRRLEGMNELRYQISTERSNFITRTEYESKQDAIQTKISDLQKFQYMAVGGMILVGVVLHYWNP